VYPNLVLHDYRATRPGIHWPAIGLVALPPAAGALVGLAGPISVIGLVLLALLFVLPLGAFLSWKLSCWVADTHAQPWGLITFVASFAGWFGGVYLAGAVRGVTL
jgi:hypothetical protein